MPDLAPALLLSEPGPSAPLCEGSTAACPRGGQEPASLQAGSLREPSWRRPERELGEVQRVLLTKCFGLDPLSLWLSWAAPRWRRISGGGYLCTESAESTAGFAVPHGCLLTGCHWCSVMVAQTGAWHLQAFPRQEPSHRLVSELGSNHPACLWVCAQHPRGKVPAEQPWV